MSTIRLHSAIHVGCSGKYRTEDKLKIQIIHWIQLWKANITAIQNYSGSVTFYNTWPGNKVGLCGAHMGHLCSEW